MAWYIPYTKQSVTEYDEFLETSRPTLASSLMRLLLVVIFRLLLLGVGGSLSFISGVAIAHFFPAKNPQMPLVEKALRRSLTQTIADLKRQYTNTSGPVTPLTPLQRQNLQAQLTQLQSQLQNLRDRTAALETEIMGSSSKINIEARLEIVSEQLDPNNSGWDRRPPTFMVTLPSDILFPGDKTTLNPNQQAILDSIISEMSSCEGSTVRIAAHTDNVGDAQDNLLLSLQRAQVVKQYLAAGKGDKYRWYAIGYGETRPLVGNDTDSKRQRNRRLEISID
ncbi:MAG: OmpA family protein [Hormoscilla sp. GM7CHS1pb]|nr:OmpA family protein [Hormoscilla sp. GM7CHS1pb]